MIQKIIQYNDLWFQLHVLKTLFAACKGMNARINFQTCAKMLFQHLQVEFVVFYQENGIGGDSHTCRLSVIMLFMFYFLNSLSAYIIQPFIQPLDLIHVNAGL